MPNVSSTQQRRQAPKATLGKRIKATPSTGETSRASSATLESHPNQSLDQELDSDCDISSLVLRDASGRLKGFETDTTIVYKLLKITSESHKASVKWEAYAKDEVPVKAEYPIKDELVQEFTAEKTEAACAEGGTNCFLPRTAFKCTSGNLLLVDNLQEGQQVLAADGSPALVRRVLRHEHQKYHIVELVTRLGSFKVSACHRIPLVGQDEALSVEKRAGELIAGEQVRMGTRGLRLTKVTHLQMWTELFSVCFDQDQSVEAFIAPHLGMQTKGAGIDLSQFSEEDLYQAMPLRYED